MVRTPNNVNRHDLRIVQRLAEFFALGMQRIHNRLALRSRQARLESVLRGAPIGIGIIAMKTAN